MEDVVIVSMSRTAIGSFMGTLSNLTAPKLGAYAIKGALNKINLKPELIEEVFIGYVISAGIGQAPARQAYIFAGIPEFVPCTTINKVCSSGMKSVMLAAQIIAIGDANIVVAGGMENMSMVPHYQYIRKGKTIGSIVLEDGMQKDGLIDAYQHVSMGVCADQYASENNFTRNDQDQFAIESYKKSIKASND